MPQPSPSPVAASAPIGGVRSWLGRARAALEPAPLVALAVIAYLALSLPAYAMLAMGGERFADDARQQGWPFWTLIAPNAFPPDYFSTYMTTQMMPWAYVRGVEGLARLFGDPDRTLAGLGLVALLACAVLAARASAAVGGRVAGWITLGLVFSFDGVARVTAGGLPRAVGCALVFLAAYGFLRRRAWATALAAMLGGVLWYPAAVMAGALFAAQMLAPRGWIEARDQQRSLSWGRRILILAGVGAATLAPILPQLLKPSPYGRLLKAATPGWPETGPGGRFALDQMLGAPTPLRNIGKWMADAMVNVDASWHGFLPHSDQIARAAAMAVFVAVTGLVAFAARREAAARRLLVIPALGLLLFAAAALAAPFGYVPGRYLSYLWTAYMLIATPYALAVGYDLLPGPARARIPASLAVSLAALAIVLAAGGRLTTQGLTVVPDRDERTLMAWLKTTPPGALVAGWPNGAVNDTPMLARRPVLLSGELFLPWHEAYAREVRARMRAVMAAWYAPGPEGLASLARTYGVRYFVVDKHARPEADPESFAPFDRDQPALRRALGGQVPYVYRPGRAIVAYENPRFLVLRVGP